MLYISFLICPSCYCPNSTQCHGYLFRPLLVHKATRYQFWPIGKVCGVLCAHAQPIWHWRTGRVVFHNLRSFQFHPPFLTVQITRFNSVSVEWSHYVPGTNNHFCNTTLVHYSDNTTELFSIQPSASHSKEGQFSKELWIKTTTKKRENISVKIVFFLAICKMIFQIHLNIIHKTRAVL